MGKRMKKKGEVGKDAAYISRNQALRKLQLSLSDFRKLCIYKGIYPRSNDSVPRFHKKDILHMAHEPLMNTLRQFHTFNKKYKKAVAMRNSSNIEMTKNLKPNIKLDNIIRERYPTFDDALRDLDDALSTVIAYAYLPRVRKIDFDLIQKCRELSIYFLHYIIASKSLEKVPGDIDFKIMNTFTYLHSTLLGFVNFKLYHSLNLVYPPKILSDNIKKFKNDEQDMHFEILSNLNVSLEYIKDFESKVQLDDFSEFENQNELKSIEEEQKKNEKFKNLFKGLKFYLSRETPREVLVLIIRSFSGIVSWEEPVSKTLIKKLPNMFLENDPTITHQIIDRPSIVGVKYANRLYIQPQWIFDCVNKKELLSATEYVPGHVLPPHISPFDNQIQESYETATSLGLKEDFNSEEEMVEIGEFKKHEKSVKDKEKLKEIQIERERRNLAIKSMPKRRKRLYEQIKKSRKYQMAGIKSALLKKQKLEKLNIK